MEPMQSYDHSIIMQRQPTKIPNEFSPERIKEWYREQANWYQWAKEYSLKEAEKVNQELEQLRVKVVDTPTLPQFIECKKLKLAELKSDARSFGDILETYRELAGDTDPNPAAQQEDCFD
jgi:hypothetical protein